MRACGIKNKACESALVGAGPRLCRLGNLGVGRNKVRGWFWAECGACKASWDGIVDLSLGLQVVIGSLLVVIWD